MSRHTRFDRLLKIENRTPSSLLPAKLNRLARRDPKIVLGVLEYWLSPQIAGSKPRVDHFH